MSSRRKNDNPEDGYLYRVVERAAGSDEEWVHSNYGTTGKPRTYMTLGAARAQRTHFVNEHSRHCEYRTRWSESSESIQPELEFGVQRAPVDNWELVV
jgi:hypothetical protein